ncbi:nucleoside deaminase [Gordonia sp. JH63]|uniref:nucleoside deaminase n=1 Tax=Gordonia sp. JH63 TaxID=2698900 RepID=UPI001EF11D7D|nr:nucleoside deaminase [Gordonia sp. JH63]
MSPDSREDPDITHLRQAIDLAARARTRGDHPFGSLLVAPDGSVVAEAMNSVDTAGDPTGHAETNVVRAVGHLDLDTRAELTLYTSTEPCAMCAGAIYWAGVGTVVYALGEDDLRGDDRRRSRQSHAGDAVPTDLRGGQSADRGTRSVRNRRRTRGPRRFLAAQLRGDSSQRCASGAIPLRRDGGRPLPC